MHKRAISIGLIFVLVVSTSGCYSTRTISALATEPPSPYFEGTVRGVRTVSGEEVAFDEPAELVIRGAAGGDPERRSTRDAEFTVIRGQVGGEDYEIHLTEVERVVVEEREFRIWLALGVGSAVTLAVIVGLIALSYRS